VDWSRGALPLGLLLFGVTAFGYFRRRAGHVVARGAYPALAAKLGLEYRPSRYASGVGTLSGTREGFAVSVDPDEQRKVTVRFRAAPKVELWSHEHNKRPGPGLVSFRPRERRLAALARTASASPELAERLEASEALGEAAERLRRVPQLKAFSVTASGVSATYDFGNPPFIPADVAEEALELLLGFARAIEPPEAPTSYDNSL
jgi:hypothetical protein